jgi:protein-L-isoaspartate(D-aspartate) O-methyltransferase
MQEEDFDLARENMVNEQIVRRGVRDPATLAAMRTVPRHLFVPERVRSFSYEDSPLPIQEGQTISQPYIVAAMLEFARLTPDSKVLEIGTGSGYAASVLSKIVKEVYTIDRIPQLIASAQKVVDELHYDNIHMTVGDGTLGWPEHAPYDAIIVTASSPVVPESFRDQLKIGGRVIIPVGDVISQQLIRLQKMQDGSYSKEILEYVRFVPLIGKQGWHEKER